MIPRFAGWPLGLAGAAALAAALSGAAASGPTAAPAPRSAATWSTNAPAVQVADTVFRHEDHASVDCLSCHTVDPVHGEVRVRTLADCRSCHHRPPLASDCSRCHTPADAPAETLTLARVLALTVGATAPRPLPFHHERHESVSCATCHTAGLSLSAAEVSCAGCHVEHHRPQADCSSCHLPRLETPPHPLEVHVGCAGSGCHSELPFEGVPRTRSLCLSCHQEMRDHKPERTCTDCHLLPRPRSPAGRGSAGGPGGGE